MRGRPAAGQPAEPLTDHMATSGPQVVELLSSSSGSSSDDTEDLDDIYSGAAPVAATSEQSAVRLLSSSDEDEDGDEPDDIYGAAGGTLEGCMLEGGAYAALSDDEPSPGRAPLNETLLLDSSDDDDVEPAAGSGGAQRDDDPHWQAQEWPSPPEQEWSSPEREWSSPEHRVGAAADAAADTGATAAGPAADPQSALPAAAAAPAKKKARRGAAAPGGSARPGKTRRTTQLVASLEQSLHARGDGVALAEQLRQEKGLKPEAWGVSAAEHTVPYSVHFCRLVLAVPYTRTAAASDGGDSGSVAPGATVVGRSLLPRAAVVLPMAALFALVDAGGLEAAAGHLRAVRSGWARAKTDDEVDVATGTGAAAAAGRADGESSCVVHYVMEALPRSEKERAVMLRQHAPRNGGSGNGGSGGSKAGKKRDASVRAELFERALLWLGVEAAGVVVHHTESPAASMDYLARLVGKLFVTADDEAGGAESGSTSRAREQFEAQAAWKPDYAALKLLAPQQQVHADPAARAAAGSAALHPLVKAYFAVLTAVPRMTPRCAIAVMRQYGTLPDLLAAYERCGPDHEDEAKLLLADLTVHNANGGQARLGPKLSGVVHVALTTTSADQKLK